MLSLQHLQISEKDTLGCGGFTLSAAISTPRKMLRSAKHARCHEKSLHPLNNYQQYKYPLLISTITLVNFCRGIFFPKTFEKDLYPYSVGVEIVSTRSKSKLDYNIAHKCKFHWISVVCWIVCMVWQMSFIDMPSNKPNFLQLGKFAITWACVAWSKRWFSYWMSFHEIVSSE